MNTIIGDKVATTRRPGRRAWLRWLGWALLVAALLALLALVIVAAGRSYITARLDDNRRINTPEGIDWRGDIELGGLRQFITIRGHDKDNPVLLYLHGGPGSALLPTAWMFQTPWEDLFTVVQWDQPGAGRTYRLNSASDTEARMTIDQHADMVCELVDHLREKLNKDKIIVLGHSWGSVLGIYAAQKCGAKFHAYVGLGQVVNLVENGELGRQFALSEAMRRGNQAAVENLQQPTSNPVPGSQQRPGGDGKTWGYSDFDGEMFGRTDRLAWWFHGKLWGPEYSHLDALSVHRVGASWVAPRLWPEIGKVDLSTWALDFDCPVIMMLGRWDYNTPSILAAEYLKQIRAPQKKLVWLERSAHVLVMEEYGRFLVGLVNHVRPLAVAEERAVYRGFQPDPFPLPEGMAQKVADRAAAGRAERGLAPLAAGEAGFIEVHPLPAADAAAAALPAAEAARAPDPGPAGTAS